MRSGLASFTQRISSAPPGERARTAIFRVIGVLAPVRRSSWRGGVHLFGSAIVRAGEVG